jgi:hypothetical protein
VAVEAGAQGGHNGQDDERENDCGEKDVGDKDEVVDGADDALRGEFHGSDVVVIDEVAGEERGGDNERGDHANDVLRLAFVLDEPPARHKKERAERVERGVDRRKVGDAHSADLPASTALIVLATNHPRPLQRRNMKISMKITPQENPNPAMTVVTSTSLPGSRQPAQAHAEALSRRVAKRTVRSFTRKN